MRIVPLSLVFLAGCPVDLPNETTLYAPTASASIELAEGQTEVTGAMVLSYSTARFPEDEVSNALRMSATARASEEPLTIVYTGDVGSPGSRNGNLDDVYQRCGQATCLVRIPFSLQRAGMRQEWLDVTADAILSAESLLRGGTDGADEVAELQIEWDDEV